LENENERAKEGENYIAKQRMEKSWLEKETVRESDRVKVQNDERMRDRTCENMNKIMKE